MGVIASEYIHSNNLPILLHLHLIELDYSDVFRDTVIKRVPIGFVYNVFIKVRYDNDKFFMAGSQLGFNYTSNEDIDNLQSEVNQRLEEHFKDYNLIDDNVNYVQLRMKSLDIKLLSEFSLDKPYYEPKSQVNATHNKLNIPIFVNDDSLGKPLEIVTVDNIIINIILKHKGKQINFLELIKDKTKVPR